MEFLIKNLPYNHRDLPSVLSYAKQLEGKSLSQVVEEEDKNNYYGGKGGLGNKVEELFFFIKNNSDALPDLQELGLEIKTTPIQHTKNGLRSKERLVFNIINFNEEYKNTFKTSTFWQKNKLLLLLFYIYENERPDIDYVFEIIRTWQFPATDLKIIKDDWEKIIAKIKEGRAHEISEGDTLYLGACTKGANKDSVRTQPFSPEKAKQRAFSLKSKYLNYIIQKSLLKEEIVIDLKEYEKILNDAPIVEDSRLNYKKRQVDDTEPIVKSIDEYQQGETFEQFITKKFEPYLGLTEDNIMKLLGLSDTKAKSKFYLIAKGILGVKKSKIEEFEKADIVLKTVRLERNGALKESMSFAQIQFKEIINEQWEESYWYNTLTKRFFFVVFQKDNEGTLRLKKVLFWTMPIKDLQIAASFWEDTKNRVLTNDYSRFIKISDNVICHVRPKGKNNSDLMETPLGTFEKKKCYWLNASYIKQIIE